MHLEDTNIREGTLVEVPEGPLRVGDYPHNFGIVTCMRQVAGCLYAEVVTNTGTHRIIEPDRLCVLSQVMESEDAEADRVREQHSAASAQVGLSGGRSHRLARRSSTRTR